MNDRIKTQMALIQYAKDTGQKHLRKNLIEDLCPGIQIDVDRIPDIVFDDSEFVPFIDVDELSGRRVTEIKQWQEEAMKTISTSTYDGFSLQSNCAPDMRTPSGRIRPRGKSNNRHFPIR